MGSHIHPVHKGFLDDCLAKAQQCCPKGSSKVDILEYSAQGSPKWAQYTNLDAYLQGIKTRDRHIPSSVNSPSAPRDNGNATSCHLRLFFISATIGDNKLHTHVDPAVLRLLHEESNLSAKFITDLYQTEDWTVFPTATELTRNVESPNRSCLQYGFWAWGDQATHSFVQLVVESDVATYYFVNFHKELKEFIETSLKEYEGSKGLGVQRIRLRRIEKHEDGSTVRDQVEELHELSREWHVMLKDFSDLKALTRQLKVFAKRVNKAHRDTQTNTRGAVPETIDSLVQFETACNFWASWARTYLNRTNICINLAHHLENKEIATQARSESISMFTLAVVTVIFLPGTFVASILSTTFFNFDGSTFTVSSLWWTLPVTTIPLTLAVLLFWYKWSESRSNKIQGQLKERVSDKTVWILPDLVQRLREFMR
ncbi:hypothetical protein HD806DRAFT_548775 [Xylariaceae sp. AK1471]|nr:hypothetical protein HD806DRAFT_548775 [Xylariaceae sp. AK1471]